MALKDGSLPSYGHPHISDHHEDRAYSVSSSYVEPSDKPSPSTSGANRAARFKECRRLQQYDALLMDMEMEELGIRHLYEAILEGYLRPFHQPYSGAAYVRFERQLLAARQMYHVSTKKEHRQDEQQPKIVLTYQHIGFPLQKLPLETRQMIYAEHLTIKPNLHLYLWLYRPAIHQALEYAKASPAKLSLWYWRSTALRSRSQTTTIKLPCHHPSCQ